MKKKNVRGNQRAEDLVDAGHTDNILSPQLGNSMLTFVL